MISEITEGILELLKADGLDVREIGFKDLVDKTINLTKPAANVTVQTAKYERVTGSSYKTAFKCDLDISVIVVFSELRGGTAGEARRKAGTYKIIEAVVQSLLGQSLGLDLENPIFPVSFRNITTPQYAQAGYSLYQIMLWCSFIVQENDKDDLGYLNDLLINYYLEPTGIIGATGPTMQDYVICSTGVIA
jgi:Domain of unknown function (DUF1834)